MLQFEPGGRLKFLKQYLDRNAIQLAARSLPPGSPQPEKVKRAAELLRKRDFLQPADIIPSLNVRDGRRFSFRSPANCLNGPNAQVHGRLFLVDEEWPTKPFVTLVHGWNAELHYLHVLPHLGRELNKAGINAATIELPYHLQRRPREQTAVRDFISDDPVGMLSATKQAVADLHSLSLWARAQGCERVAVWGFSLGAWLAGLYVSESALPGAAILTTPVSNLARAVTELEFCHPIRAGIASDELDLSPLNLESRRPCIPPENIHLVQSAFDLFVPSESYSELAAAWRLPGWAREKQGHISILVSRGAMRRSIRWLKGRLLP